METLLIPFQYDFLQKAMWVSALIGGLCALLSCFVTLKGWSLMGDALSHAVVPGVTIAHLLGAPFAVGAFLSGLLAAGAMGLVKEKTALRGDAVIGVVFTTFFAAGLLLISLFPTGLSLNTIVFGNILSIAETDLLQVLIVSGLVLLALALKWRDLLLYCFDANQARALGLRAGWLHFLLLAMLSAMAVAAFQTVGAVLVVAMLITPGATAYLLTDRFPVMLGLSAAMGAGTGFLGAYGAYFLNGSTGGCIVLLQTALFGLAFLFAPGHGVLAIQRRRRLALAGPSVPSLSA